MQKVSELFSDSDKTALYQSFAAACSDKDFKDFVYGLNIKEEVPINTIRDTEIMDKALSFMESL